MSLTNSERLERVVFNGGAGGFCLLAYALRSAIDGHSWEAAGFGLIGLLYVLVTVCGRRPANRVMTAVLISVHAAAFVTWMVAADSTLRTSAFTIAVAAYGLVALLAWSDGVPVEPPQREQPITLNLSSR